jgi:hypothetical protein
MGRLMCSVQLVQFQWTTEMKNRIHILDWDMLSVYGQDDSHQSVFVAKEMLVELESENHFPYRVLRCLLKKDCQQHLELAVKLSNLILKIGPYFLFYATRDTTNLPVVFEDTDRGSRSNICVRVNVTDNGKALVTNISGTLVTNISGTLVTNISGTLHTVAHEELVSGPMAVMQEHQII